MKIKNKNILTFTLLCSFITLSLQGRPGPGSGDYPAESTGFVKGDDWDDDTTGITFLNKWRAQQQLKTSPTKKVTSVTPDREALRKKLMADFERLMNDIEASTSDSTKKNHFQVIETASTTIEADTKTGAKEITDKTEEIVRGIVDSAE